MSRTSTRLGALLAIACGTCPARADAPRARYMSPSEVAAASPGIAIVQVERVTTTQLGNRVYTDITAALAQSIKGDIQTRVAIRQPGGRFGDLVTVSGPMPAWQPGETWVMCLAHPPHGWWTTYGMVQGAFRVEDETAVRDLRGLALIPPVPAGLSNGIERIPLTDLLVALGAPTNLPPAAAATGIPPQTGEPPAVTAAQTATPPVATSPTPAGSDNSPSVPETRPGLLILLLVLIVGGLLLYARHKSRC